MASRQLSQNISPKSAFLHLQQIESGVMTVVDIGRAGRVVVGIKFGIGRNGIADTKFNTPCALLRTSMPYLSIANSVISSVVTSHDSTKASCMVSLL